MSADATTGEAAEGRMSPKRWNELTGDEKMERLREVVKRQSRENERLKNDVRILERKLANHSHEGRNGEIVMPMIMFPGSGLGDGLYERDMKSEWF